MADEGVTVAQGVPTQWALMLASEELDAADLGCPARRRNRRGAHDGLHGGRGAPTLRRAGRRALHIDGIVLGHRHHTDLHRRGGGDHRGAPGRRRRARHRRRRRRSGARRIGRAGAPAIRRGHARLLGPRPRPGSPHRRSWWTRRPPASVLGTGRVADHRRLRAAHRRGQPAVVRPRPRALHPRWLQRLPGRGRGGPVVAPRRGQGRRRRRA